MKLYFKTIFAAVVPFVVTMFCAYLVGSFIDVSWSPEMWTLELRMFMSMAGVAFGFMLYAKLYFEGTV